MNSNSTPFFKRKRYILLFSLLHAFWMMVFTVWWLNQAKSFGDERALITISTFFKRWADQDYAKDFVFINTAYDIELIDKTGPDGSLLGKEVITDRQALSQLMNSLNSHADEFKQVVCDIYFIDQTPNDSSLNQALKTLNDQQKILISSVVNKDYELIPPIFEVDHGVSNYASYGDFFKFSLVFPKGEYTIPARLYQRLENRSIRRHQLGPIKFYTDTYRPSLNYIAPNFYLLQKDLANTSYFQLKEFLFLSKISKAEIKKTLKDKIIIVGDFEKYDMHESMHGKVAGPLILANTYLSLKNQGHILTYGLLIILFIAYFIITLLTLLKKNYVVAPELFLGIRRTKIMRFFAKFQNMLLLIAISLLASFYFGININIMVLILYLFLFEYLLGMVRN